MIRHIRLAFLAVAVAAVAATPVSRAQEPLARPPCLLSLSQRAQIQLEPWNGTEPPAHAVRCALAADIAAPEYVAELVEAFAHAGAIQSACDRFVHASKINP
jgi:hypothetical protein